MASLTKEEKREKREKLFNNIMWVPLCILLGIVPLIVKMVLFYPTGRVLDILNTSLLGDVYSSYKATAIITLCVIMAIIVFLGIEKENIKWDKTIKLYLIGAGIFLVVSLISTVLSENSYTAWWGLPDRAEGFVMNGCYIFMTAYTLYALRSQKNYTYILVALSFLIVMTMIVGVSQYFGYDIFMNVSFFKNLILGKEGLSLGMDLTSDFEKGKVFGTMAHYNYMGSFGAMMLPFFLVLTVFIRDKKKKAALAVITLCAMFLLFGSTSRAGIIGLVCSFIVIVIIFIKPIIKKWKYTVPIIVALVAVLFGFNAITKGAIFTRIPSLLHESIGLFAGSDESFNYLDHIPVRGVTYEDGKQKVELQEHTLYIGSQDNSLIFTDENGNVIEYVMGMGMVDNKPVINYSTTDERFSLFSFRMEEVKGAEEGKEPTVFSMIYNNISTFCFMLDENKGVIMIDTCPIKEEAIEFPEAIGFKGKEKLGSQRGYIWSRSIPLMKKTLLKGYGPDNFALVFPQNDYLGKWWAYNTPNMIVDKVHNLYMGIWINNGALSLVGFLIVMIAYIVQSIKLYAFKEMYTMQEILGIATMTAIVGYLGAGFFNDSVVSVTPIFSILLGAGMGINYLIQKQRVTMK